MGEARPFGLTKRIPWTTSRVVGSPEPPPPYRLKRVFPRLKFQGPVCIAQEPETNRLMVAENAVDDYYCEDHGGSPVGLGERLLLAHTALDALHTTSEYHPPWAQANLTEANVDGQNGGTNRWISYLSTNTYLWAYGNGGGLANGWIERRTFSRFKHRQVDGIRLRVF